MNEQQIPTALEILFSGNYVCYKVVGNHRFDYFTYNGEVYAVEQGERVHMVNQSAKSLFE